MVTRVKNAAAGEGGQAAQITPVREGGDALNLRQGAEAIGGLDLFGEDGDLKPKQDGDGDDTQRGTKTNRGGEGQQNTDDQTQDDGNEGNQDEGDENAGDDDAGQQDDDGKSDGETGDKDEGGKQDADGEGNETPIESLAQLAEALEVDENFLGDLNVTFKADGEDVTVPLAELQRGYQRDANYRRQTQELAETRKALETQHATVAQHYEGQLVQLSHVLHTGEQLLVGELNTAEMQHLRTTNPAEWAARREEMQQRINGVKQLYNHAAQQYEAHTTQQAQAMKAQLIELRRAEMDNLRTAIPEWGDDLRDKLTGYLDTAYGYTGDDLKQVFDSRLIALANKARLYDEMQAVGAKTKKKVVNLPKVQKGGKRPTGSKGTKNAANFTKARNQLKKSGKLQDAAALIGFIEDI